MSFHTSQWVIKLKYGFMFQFSMVWITSSYSYEIRILHYKLHSSLTYVGYGGYTKMQMIRKYKLNNLVNPILLQW